MINEYDFISSIVLLLDNKIHNFAVNFEKETIAFNTLTINEASILFERTISSHLNCELSSILASKGLKPDLFVNEFYVQFKNGINVKEFSEMREKLSLESKHRKEMWNNCAVDGYFNFKNNPYINHLFVEYKLNLMYSYTELALDYLKFKCLTRNSDEGCWFAFINCKKEKLYPTIVNNVKDPFVFIYESSKKKLSKYRVFVYKPEDASQKRNPTDLIDDVRDLRDSVKMVEEIGVENHAFNKRELLFLNSMDKYNKNIIKSRIIKNNYAYILNAWELLNENGFFQDIEEKFTTSGVINSEEIIKEGADCKRNLFNKIGTIKKADALQNNIRGSYHASLSLLLFIEYYIRLLNLKTNIQIKPGNLSFGYGKNKMKVDFEKIKESQMKDIDRNYNTDPDKMVKLNKLNYCVLYYLVNTLPLIYRQKDNTLGDINDNYLLYEKKLDIKEKIRRIYKKMETHVNFDSLLLEDDFSNELEKVVAKILEYY